MTTQVSQGQALYRLNLSCGAISIKQCISEARKHNENWLENTWVNELIWRELYRHLTDAYPHLSRSENFRATRKPIPWINDKRQWEAWCKGETGFPIVDAAMKQLKQTGWMHNRLRMISAAFLTKLLLIDWRKGEAFFMSKLIDGDFSSNNGGWQWAASTGQMPPLIFVFLIQSGSHGLMTPMDSSSSNFFRVYPT